jgi:multiple sugar transport system substrate-binding protein
MFSSDRISQGQLLGARGEVALVAAAVGIAPKFIRPSRANAANASPPGMVRRPMGLEGCERRQHGEDTPENRTIEGIKVFEADVSRSRKPLGDKFMANGQ